MSVLRTYRPTGALVIRNPLPSGGLIRRRRRILARRPAARRRIRRIARRRRANPWIKSSRKRTVAVKSYSRKGQRRYFRKGPAKRRRARRSLGTLQVRSNPGHRRRRTRRTRRYSAIRRRRNPSRRRRSSARRYSRARRRNPMGLGSMFSRIPIIGGFLSSIVSMIPFAGAGAVSVEPSMWLAKWLTGMGWFESVPSSLFYAVSSLVLAALVSKFAPLSGANKKLLATAIAAAGGGVGYYKWRSGDSELPEEVGQLMLSGWGGGPAALGFQEDVVPLQRVVSQ